MKIHRIRLENYRGVSEREIELAPSGVTVIHGPNEIGKTSQVEAITVLLDYKDDSRSELVRSLQPSGRDEAPVVEVEFESGSYRLTYRKQFIRRPKTELVIHAPERKTMTGRPAHHMVQKILAETLDEDLWRALRIDQGSRPEQAQLGSILSLGAALDRAAGEAPAGDSDVALFDRVHEEYLRYFTERGHPARALKQARALREEAEAQVDKIKHEMQGLDDDIARAVRLEAELQNMREQELHAGRLTTEAETRWQAVLGLADAVETRRNQRDVSREKLKLATNELALRDQLVAQVGEAEARMAELAEELRALEPNHSNLMAHHKSVSEQVTRARRSQADALDAYGLRHRQFQFRRDEFDLKTLTERYQRVEEATAAAATATSILAESTIDEDVLEDIKAKSIDVERARGALVAGGALVSIRSLGPELHLDVDGYPMQIKAGEPGELKVTESLVLKLADQLELELRPGSTVDGLAKELQVATDEVNGLLLKAGATDLKSAEQALEKRRTAQLALTHARETIEANLRDLTLEEMQAKIAALRVSLDTSPDEGLGMTSPSLEDARRGAHESEQALHAAQRSLHEAEADLETATRQTEQLSERRLDLEAALRALQEQLRVGRARLEEARAQGSDAQLQDANAEAEKAFRLAEAELAQAETELGERAPDDLRRLAEDADTARDGIAARVAELHQAHIELMADLRARGELGLHARLEEAEGALEEAQREADRLEGRAAAAKLLYETMSNNRQAATRGYVRPLKDAIERLGRVVFGDSFGVELDETLQISNRVLDGSVVGFKHLSGGAKEQLSLITRIACASLVSQEDGAPVLIDDALGNSDPQRLEAMAAVLSLVGRTCQVILLTCHPGWYARIAGAKVVSFA